MQVHCLLVVNCDVFYILQSGSLVPIRNVSSSLVNGHKNEMQRNIKGGLGWAQVAESGTRNGREFHQVREVANGATSGTLS